ncbi:unnamed protein product [Closterium sp. NIES-64]|nr:unnamed protein product [Closterium sp. NIES-65]CAI5983622.1 unnamed protein product [Closterium sp. NIES-64]
MPAAASLSVILLCMPVRQVWWSSRSSLPAPRPHRTGHFSYQIVPKAAARLLLRLPLMPDLLCGKERPPLTASEVCGQPASHQGQRKNSWRQRRIRKSGSQGGQVLCNVILSPLCSPSLEHQI